jgi:PIN domain
MKKSDAVVFIDANLYLDLYEVTEGKRLLAPLKEQQDYIFITVQVVEEVQRRKLKLAADFLSRQFENLKLRNVGVPDHLFDISGETASKLREKLRDIYQKITEINEELITAAIQTLQRISVSEDEVSKTLSDLFSKAVTPTAEELHRARERKERGNPPGKKADTLGDQLTWEQLLSYCMDKSNLKLWIISKDRDFFTEYKHTLLLNPLLQQDLAGVFEPGSEVFCFDSIDKGIRDFVERTKVRAETLPTLEESKAIEKELNSLPPRGWLDTSMDDANMVAMLSRRQISPALWANLSGSNNTEWLSKMVPAPDKTDK